MSDIISNLTISTQDFVDRLGESGETASPETEKMLHQYVDQDHNGQLTSHEVDAFIKLTSDLLKSNPAATQLANQLHTAFSQEPPTLIKGAIFNRTFLKQIKASGHSFSSDSIAMIVNRWADRNHDGQITREEASAFVKATKDHPDPEFKYVGKQLAKEFDLRKVRFYLNSGLTTAYSPQTVERFAEVVYTDFEEPAPILWYTDTVDYKTQGGVRADIAPFLGTSLVFGGNLGDPFIASVSGKGAFLLSYLSRVETSAAGSGAAPADEVRYVKDDLILAGGQISADTFVGISPRGGPLYFGVKGSIEKTLVGGDLTSKSAGIGGGFYRPFGGQYYNVIVEGGVLLYHRNDTYDFGYYEYDKIPSSVESTFPGIYFTISANTNFH